MQDFDAFISYSHTNDLDPARAIERELKRFARPWNRRRALDVFRDESILGASSELEGEIQDALDRSRFLVMLLSPAAAASYWMSREFERFTERHELSQVLLVVVDGTIAWDSAAGAFTPTSTVPEALRSGYSTQPLWVDLRSDRGIDHNRDRFRDAIATIAAPIHGRSKDDLIGEDFLQHRKAQRVRRIATVGLLTLTVLALLATTFALLYKDESVQAQRRRDDAVAERVLAEEAADAARAEEAAAVAASDAALSARAAAEAARDLALQEQGAAEIDRQQAEEARTSAEEAKAEAETERAAAEAATDEALAAQAEAESARDAAESARMAAEQEVGTLTDLNGALERAKTNLECAKNNIDTRLDELQASFDSGSDVDDKIDDIRQVIDDADPFGGGVFGSQVLLDGDDVLALADQLDELIEKAVARVERAEFTGRFIPACSVIDLDLEPRPVFVD